MQASRRSGVGEPCPASAQPIGFNARRTLREHHSNMPVAADPVAVSVTPRIAPRQPCRGSESISAPRHAVGATKTNARFLWSQSPARRKEVSSSHRQRRHWRCRHRRSGPLRRATGSSGIREALRARGVSISSRCAIWKPSSHSARSVLSRSEERALLRRPRRANRAPLVRPPLFKFLRVRS